MSTDARHDRLWKNTIRWGADQDGRWIPTLLDKTGDLTARGVLFLFGASTAMVCYVLSCSMG